MGMTAEAYRSQLQALLPTGAAWSREPSSMLAALSEGLAQEFTRVDGRAENLIAEVDPRTANELLDDWERVFDLPDPCVTAAQTINERRAALLAKIINSGGATPQFFVGIAAALGYTVTITEFPPATCVSPCTTGITNGDWVFCWQVNAPSETVTELTCNGNCDQPLRSWGNELLECVIERLKPAHTKVQFAYS